MPNMEHGKELSSIDFKSMIGGPLSAVIEAQAEAALTTVNFIKSVGFKAGEDKGPEDTNTKEPIYVTFKYPKEVAPYQPGLAGFVETITIGNAGAGYTAIPAVTIDDPPTGGTLATAVAEIDGGAVASITITEPGAGYTAVPTVAIDDPPTGGTLATATAGIGNRASVPAQYQEMKLEVPILTMLPIPYIRVEEVTIDFNAKINSMEYKKLDTSLGVDASLKFKQRWPGGSVKLNVNVSYKRNTSSGQKVERTYSLAIQVRAVQDETPGGMERILGILEDAIRSQPTSIGKPTPAPVPPPS